MLRPSPRAPRARRQIIEGAGLGAVLIAALVILDGVARSPFGWALMALCAVWYGVLPWLYFHNASLYVRDGRVGKTDLLGRRTEVDVVRVTAVHVVPAGGRSRRIVVEDAAGAALLTVYATAWRTSQIDALRQALGLEAGSPR
ncbi:MAG TPA: hypothetical protein VI316_06675 [Candidatus Dormibacteraeota bacterium]